ncbi:hypothetical protein ACIQ6R_15955 [Streptomyces sp. NPDC096048]|uniref:hypothetical protein n=1 Tax=Streptomyces sp. NPDC096048 TaxID=3366072 RepID=UPI0038065C97
MDLLPMSAFQRTGGLWLPPQAPVAVEPEPPVTIRMVGDRRMQCKDIPDEAFIDAVRRAGEPGSWRMSWKVESELAAVVGPVPYNLFLAKARRLCGRKLLHGCPCGCRGDFHPPEECRGC